MLILRTKSCCATVMSHHRHAESNVQGPQVALAQFSEFTGDECTYRHVIMSKVNCAGDVESEKQQR
jgi:hypothetical protein